MSWITWLGYVLVCTALRLAFWPAAEAALDGDGWNFLGVMCIGLLHDGIAGWLLKCLAFRDTCDPHASPLEEPITAASVCVHPRPHRAVGWPRSGG